MTADDVRNDSIFGPLFGMTICEVEEVIKQWYSKELGQKLYVFETNNLEDYNVSYEEDGGVVLTVDTYQCIKVIEGIHD